MKNNELFLTMVSRLQEIIYSYDFKISHRMKAKDFSRKGKIGFENMIMLMLNFFKKSAFIEIYNFFERIIKTDETISRQAFEQARMKISHTAFVELFEETVQNGLSTDDPKLYQGYRLLAIDGSTLMLENSNELKAFYGASTPSKGDVFARISMLFDVLNGFIVDAGIEPFSTGERRMAISHVGKLSKLGCTKNIIIMDRGYWSPELISSICENDGKFLMRVASNVSKAITGNPNNSGFFTLKYNSKSYKLRFYKFVLDSGEVEYLVTNVDSCEISDENLAELYFMRWGIETKYKEVKVYLQMENFTGKTVLSVLQDFYATVFLSNMVAFAKLQSDENIAQSCKDKNLKYQYKTNTNITIGILKDRLILAIMEKNAIKRLALIRKIFKAISKNTTPIKPNRSAPRKQSSIKYRKRTVTKSTL